MQVFPNNEHFMDATILHGDCISRLSDAFLERQGNWNGIDLTFLDPPFNQSKEYEHHDDGMTHAEYWAWMERVCSQIFELTGAGGALYFMQREKNVEDVMRTIRQTGWTFQNLIIWKKMTSAVPGNFRFGKSHQIIVFATKGMRPRVFNRLRINPPPLAHHKYERPNGMYVTDVWDDVRELTSGYFAGDEALRNPDGSRFHKQQTPIQLLLRVILSSSMPDDTVLDPFAGSGTTSVVCAQTNRRSIAVDIDELNVARIKQRLNERRLADNVEKSLKAYSCTPEIATISGMSSAHDKPMPSAKIVPAQIHPASTTAVK